jgi:hypothetical protein
MGRREDELEVTPCRSSHRRFEAEQRRKAAQHPLFSTSAAEYGKVPRGASADCKMVCFKQGGRREGTVRFRVSTSFARSDQPEHGKKGAFSTTFPSGPPAKDTRLNTSTSKNRFLPEFDP